MAMIPAVCSSCGTVFGMSNLISGDQARFEMTGARIGPCPHCGGMGKVPDGVYQLHDDALEVVRSAGIEPDVLQGIVGMLEALKRGETSRDEVIEGVGKEAPALQETVERALAHPNTAQWIAILIQIILGLLAMSNQAPSAHEIAEELRSQPLRTYSASGSKSTRRERQTVKRRRPLKQFGKSKQRKSRKRR